jgi:hypothetical protein
MYYRIIRGAVVDASFLQSYDQQFRPRIAEHGLKVMTIDGYNLSPKGRYVVEARQQPSFQFLLQSHLMILISK